MRLPSLVPGATYPAVGAPRQPVPADSAVTFPRRGVLVTFTAMDLLVIRHAIAEEREEFAATGRPDRERPLTDRGRRRMQRAAHGLTAIVPALDVLATSPFRRAVETATIVAKAFDGPELLTLDELTPEVSPPSLGSRLHALRHRGMVAIVGHEPALSSAVGWLLTGDTDSFLEIKKGAACLLTLSDPRQPGEATLRWALTPRQLRLLHG